MVSIRPVDTPRYESAFVNTLGQSCLDSFVTGKWIVPTCSPLNPLRELGQGRREHDRARVAFVWRVEWANTRMVMWLSVRSRDELAQLLRRPPTAHDGLLSGLVRSLEVTLHERDDAASLRIRWAKRNKMRSCLN